MEESPTPPQIVPESAQKGFVSSMLDLTFRSFVTPNLVKVLYFIGLAAVVYYVIAFLLNGGFTGFVIPYMHRKESRIRPSVAFDPTTGTGMFAIAGAL